MFRTLILAAAATTALGFAALTPTTASAHGWHGHGHFHGHFHRHWGPRFYPAIYGGYGYGGGCYIVKKLVPTPYGLMPRRVTVCS